MEDCQHGLARQDLSAAGQMMARNFNYQRQKLLVSPWIFRGQLSWLRIARCAECLACQKSIFDTPACSFSATPFPLPSRLDLNYFLTSVVEVINLRILTYSENIHLAIASANRRQLSRESSRRRWPQLGRVPRKWSDGLDSPALTGDDRPRPSFWAKVAWQQ